LVILLVWQVIDRFAADYFMGLMKQFNVDPRILNEIFLRATHQFLLVSLVLGLVLVTLLSFFIPREVMRSLTQMIAVTRRLAIGDYSERVHVTTNDEVGELGKAFNRMADSLQRIEAMRKELVANVAHELRTPLNTLRGELEALQDRLIPLTPEAVNSLHEEALRLVRLVEALHRLSQIDADARSLKKEPLDLQALIRELVKKEASRFDQKSIRLSVDTVSVTVLADRDQMIQVAQNLIRNILQYTPEGGAARIETFLAGDAIHVRSINSGEGIRSADLPYIFERFYRGEKSRSRESGGAGIGLAIVKQIVEAHGGTVGADSRPGETRVWFTLPL